MIEIDRPREDFKRTKFAGAASSVIVAIGSHHHDRQIGEPFLDLGQQLQAVHAQHVDVGENRDKRGLDLLGEPIQRLRARSRNASLRFPGGLHGEIVGRKRSATSGSSSTTRTLALRADSAKGITLMTLPLPSPSREYAAIEW
jgi:hypothetical protein